jgi:hypothetical protein
MRVLVDDSTKKKAGRQSEGIGWYRNGAGSARQAYRTLRGLHCVLGLMPIPLKGWPGHRLSIPIGFALSLTSAQAQELGVPYRSRSQLARGLVAKDDGRDVPATGHAGGRFPISAQLYEPPPMPAPKRRGAPRKKGELSGSLTTLASTETGWAPHPSEAGAEVQAWGGLWHAVLPGQLIRVVVVRREATHGLTKPRHRTPPPPVEACFATEPTLSIEAILRE